MQTQHDPALVLRLFGPMVVQVRGEPKPISGKGPWLLALLILREGRTLERAWLAETLWPDVKPPENARGNLRSTLSRLREALGDEANRLLKPTFTHISLDLTVADIDVVTFDQDVQTDDPARLEKAVELYGGELLEGCYEDWVGQERESRKQAFLGALEKLANQALQRQDDSEAIRYLRRLVATEPLRATAQQNLMQALANCGDYAAAKEVYRDYCNYLYREMNIKEPESEITTLFQRLNTESQQGTEVERISRPPADDRLPRFYTELIGREAAAAELRRHLEARPLVTLVGTGGVGKTRLAVRVAEECADAFPDGLRFVDLSPLNDGELVTQAVARAFGVRETPGQSLLSTLTDTLASRTALLVLDNCEHLIEACARLVDTLLACCPSMRLLATSRQALGVAGEIPWHVPSLPLPPLMDPQTAKDGALRVEDLLDYASVLLFLERVLDSEPRFALNAGNAPAAVQICRRLDGIPLALELAAARIRSLTMEEIAARLDERFRLLTGGSRMAPTRQQTLLATMDWSYDLLTESERLLLRRLSVFGGGWTLKAAEQVCSGEGIEEGGVLDVLTSLVNQSLVVYDAQGGTDRYWLLETVRAYASGKLEAQRETESMRRRHRDYFLSLAEKRPHRRNEEFGKWLDCMEMESDNLRVALEWCEKETERALVGLRMAIALPLFWEVHGHFRDGQEHLSNLLSLTKERAEALDAFGIMERVMGSSRREFDRAWSYHEQSLAISQLLNDKIGEARALKNQGYLAFHQGRFGTSWEKHISNLRLRLELAQLPELAAVLNDIAVFIRKLQEWIAGEKSRLPSLRLIGDALNDLAVVERAQCEVEGRASYALACSLHALSYEIRQRMEDRLGEASSLNTWGMTLQLMGKYADARQKQEEGLEIRRQLGDSHGIEYSLGAFATLAAAEAREALDAGDMARADTLARRAARLFGAADKLRRSHGAVLHKYDYAAYDEREQFAQARLGKQIFDQEFQQGSDMDLDAAIGFALNPDAWELDHAPAHPEKASLTT